jgi:hypothetical protein
MTTVLFVPTYYIIEPENILRDKKLKSLIRTAVLSSKSTDHVLILKNSQCGG